MRSIPSIRRWAPVVVLSVLVVTVLGARLAESETWTNAVYTAQSQSGENNVAAFLQSRTNGRLSLVGTYSTGGIGAPSVDGNQSHGLVSNGDFLFVTNSGDDSISVFRIGRKGTLRKVGKYSSGGAVPVSLAIKGSRLLVANQGSSVAARRGSLRVFKIRRDGSLARLRQGHFEYLPDDAPSDILTSESSSIFSVGLSGSNRVDHYELLLDGSIVRTDSVQGIVAPLGGVVKSSPQTTFVYTLPDASQPGVISLQVDREGKTVRMYQDSRDDLRDPCWAAIHPDGRRVWLSSFETRAVSLYSISRDGTMKAISDYTPITAGPGATDIAVDLRGRYLFRLRGFDVDAPSTPLFPVVDTFRINSSSRNAGLALVGTAPLPDSWASTGTTGIVSVLVPSE